MQVRAMLKKTVSIASEKVEIVAEPETLECELYPGVTLKWQKEVNVTEQKIALFKTLLELLFRENSKNEDVQT